MKVLNIYRNEPNDDTKKLATIVSEGNESEGYNLYEGEPDYDTLVDMIFAADKTICWW